MSRNMQFTYLLIFLTGCVQNSDCPNEGLNYECNTNGCVCASGFVLNGDDCVLGIV